MLRSTLIIILIGLAGGVHAQMLAEKSALNNLEKNKWDRAKEKIIKLKAKDSLAVAADYIYSLYFFADANKDYQLDSAHFYVEQALQDFIRLDSKERDRLLKLPLDSSILCAHKGSIDSAAFRRALDANTEDAFVFFLKHYPNTVYSERAIEIRDEIAYLDALKANTYHAFANYLRKYPESKRSVEARDRYEKLFYQDQTKDQKLRSFVAFLEVNPTSPFRADAERQIFEISTADAKPEHFQQYVKAYPNSCLEKRARDIVYWLSKEGGWSATESLWYLTDSLKQFDRITSNYLIPILENKLYGFMDNGGSLVIHPTLKEIPDSYLCGNIEEDLLVDGTKLMNRAGDYVREFNSPITGLDELGYGFVLVETGACVTTIHKSGFQVGPDCIEDAFVLSRKYIAIQTKGLWSIFSFGGRMIHYPYWDNLKEIGTVIGLQKNDRWTLTTPEAIALMADNVQLAKDHDFAEVKSWPSDMVWVRKGEIEGVMDNQLNVVVPLGIQNISLEFMGFLSQSSSGKKLYHINGSQSSNFLNIKINKPWIIVVEDNSQSILDPENFEVVASYDLVKTIGTYAVGYRRDSVFLHTAPGRVAWLPKDFALKHIATKEPNSFLLVDRGKKKAVFDQEGKELFELECDDIRYAGSGVFVYDQGKLKGLVDQKGKRLTKPHYDAIGELDSGKIPLLRKLRFGWYDIETDIELEPAFDKNLLSISSQWVLAYEKGHYGLIDRRGKKILDFTFDATDSWNDSSIWVKQGGQWRLITIPKGETIIDGVTQKSDVRNDNTEKICIVKKEGEYGVVSNRSGWIIPATFSDVINIGSVAEPLYFTEKHVSEASLYVVIYYDKKGKLIRKQAFEGDDYDSIYCNK